jgi:hypothetical protein
MPSGYRRTTPLAKCARKGCPERIKAPRQRYCSKDCFGLATRGQIRPSKPRTFDGRFNQFTINPSKQAVSPERSYWWFTAPREGFTAHAERRSFSHDKKAMVLPVWIQE